MNRIITCLPIVAYLQIEALTLRGEGRRRAFLYDDERIKVDVSQSEVADFILKNTAQMQVGDFLQVRMNCSLIKNKLNQKYLHYQIVEILGFFPQPAQQGAIS